jgi:hypothetical protein
MRNFLLFAITFFFLNCNAQIPSDSIWEKKINHYRATEKKFFRTIVKTDGASAFSELVREHRGLIQANGAEIRLEKVHELVLGNYRDIIYSVGQKSYMNYKGLIGLSVNQYIRQQFSPNFYLFNSSSEHGDKVVRQQGNYIEIIPSTTQFFDTLKKWIGFDEIYDLKSQQFTRVNLPQYNFEFDKITPFPYLRITTPKDIKNNFNETNNNSDLLYSICNKELYDPVSEIIENKYGIIQNSLFIPESRKINFSSSQNYFKLGDYIYNTSDGERLDLSVQIGGDVEYRKYNVNYVVTFNDSFFVIANHRISDNVVILNVNTDLVYNLNLNKIGNLSDLIFIEIDKFGKYLYLESKNKLTVFDCQFNKIAFQGPYVGIDYTMDKVGWIMTKALRVSLNKDAIPTNTDIKELTKSGFSWKTENVYRKPEPGTETWFNKTHIFERFLIDLSNILDTAFCDKIGNLVSAALPRVDYFTDISVIERRKTTLFDSLLLCSYTWIKGIPKIDNRICFANNSQNLDSVFIEFYNANLKIVSSIDSFKESEVYPYLIEKGINRFSVEKQVDSESHLEFFNFHLEVDSIPTQLLNNNTSAWFHPILCTKKEAFRDDFSTDDEFLNPQCLRIMNEFKSNDGYNNWARIEKNSKYYPHRNSENLLGFVYVPANSATKITDSLSNFTFNIEIFNNEFAKGLWSEFANNNCLDIDPNDNIGNVNLKIAKHQIGSYELSNYKLELDLFENTPLMMNKKGSKNIPREMLYINNLNLERNLWKYELSLDFTGYLNNYMYSNLNKNISPYSHSLFNSLYTYYIHDIVFMHFEKND